MIKYIKLKKYLNKRRLNNHLKKVISNPNNDKNYILPLSFITHADVEPIAACNLRCSFCPVPGWDRAKSTRAMSMELFKGIIDQLPNLTSVKLQGNGEPLINPKLKDMIKYCSKKGIETAIVNNGTLLKQKIAQELLESGLNTIAFSIDGATKETYENARPGADFDQVINNIKYLVKLKKSKNHKTIIKIDCLASNQKIFEEIPQLVNLVSDIGVDSLSIKAALKVWKKVQYRNKNEQSLELEKTIHLEKRKNHSSIIQEAKKIAFEKNLKLSIGSIENDIYTKQKPCTWPWDKLFIGTEGKVVPCCVIGIPETWSFGDLTIQNINKIWNNEDYINLRKGLITGNTPNLCKPCYGKLN